MHSFLVFEEGSEGSAVYKFQLLDVKKPEDCVIISQLNKSFHEKMSTALMDYNLKKYGESFNEKTQEDSLVLIKKYPSDDIF